MKYEMTENTKFVDGMQLTQIRYENGSIGGWIKDESVLPQDSKAVVHPYATIFGGVIHGGVIWGGVIRGGVIHGGVIWGGVLRGGVIHGGLIRGGEIRGGVIRGGEIWGGLIRGGVIWGGLIRGGVIHGGVIWGGVLRGGVIHGGEIRGGEIWGVIHTGMIVTRDPIHLILPRHHVTISDNMVAVGCQVQPFEFWKDKKKVQALGDDNEYTQQEIDLYYSTVNMWLTYQES